MRNQPELDLQKACTAYLQLDGWRALAMEPMSRRDWGKGFGEIGMADHLYIRYGWAQHVIGGADAEVLWIEYKSPDGRVTTGQKLWHSAERKRGAMTAIAKIDFEASIDGFMKWYRLSGLARRVVRMDGAA